MKLNQSPLKLGENDIDYKRALEAVEPLLDKDKCFVRRVRKRHLLFQCITKADIIKQFPELESKDEDLNFLISEFGKGSGC